MRWNVSIKLRPVKKSFEFLLVNISFGLYDAEKITELPKVGDTVHVSSLDKRATVLKVDTSKEEIVVQAGIMKLKLKATDVQR